LARIGVQQQLLWWFSLDLLTSHGKRFKMNGFHNIELVLKFKCSSISEANHMAKQAMEELGNTDETPLFKEAELWIDAVKVQTSFLNTILPFPPETVGLTGSEVSDTVQT
jgi:hypothetical protein